MYDDFDYEPIEELARREGCTIDDDGHWIPLKDAEDDDFEFCDEDMNEDILFYDDIF